MRRRLLASGAGAACLVLGLAGAPAHAADPVIAAAGDIACDPTGGSFNGGLGDATHCRQKYTSDLLVDAGLSAALPLGDVQYEEGTLAQFQASYDPSWGRFKSITRPAIGNHEYRTGPNGEQPTEGYFDYFNGAGNATGPAGERGVGYYSFDVGENWHLIAINSMCDRVAGGCSAGSPQEQWLRADLAANSDAACTVAYWHHPLFNSGPDGDYKDTPWDTTALWQALYEGGAELVLTGHSHRYERFAPQDAAGGADPDHGVREFIVGTGGKSLGANGIPQPNSEIRLDTYFGVLKLVLHANGYDWTFLDDAGQTRDSGSGTCHGAPDLTPPETSISAGVQGLTRQTAASFSFASSETGSTFRCKLNGPGTVVGTETACTSPKAYSSLANGAYSFSVYAVDAEGNADPTPATRSFTVDATPPNTSITGGPSGTTTATTASFSFTSTEAGSAYSCKIDAGAWAACTSPKSYTGLSVAKHTFQVRATDAAGNTDATPATRSWTVKRASTKSPTTSVSPSAEPSSSEPAASLRWTEERPSSYELLSGEVFRRRGAVRRLYRNDDNRLEIAAAGKRSGMYVSAFEAFVPVDPTSNSLRISYNGGSSARRTALALRVFNYRTEEWVKIYGQRVGRRERSFEWAASIFAADYVSPAGDVRIRVRAKRPGTFRTRTDLIGLAVQY